MKTCALADVGEFSLQNRTRPSIDVDEVLIRVNSVGICGSDIHYYQHGRNGDNVVSFPHVLGHEVAGTVVEVGRNVTFSTGNRVAIEPGKPCKDCHYCTEGDYHLCAGMEYLSSPPVDGALTQYIAWPAEYVYPLPETVSVREGALVEPLSVAMHACRRAGVGNGDSVLVTGSGPIGMLVAEVALSHGAETVVMTDVVPRKLELAEERGVDLTVNASLENPVERIHNHVDHRGVDIVIESSGAEPAVETTMDAVRRGGTVVFVGIPPETGLPVGVVESIEGEYDLKGSFRFKDTYPAAIEGIQQGRFDVGGIVSFEEPLDRTQKAFERAAAPTTVKGMIRIDESGQ